MSSLKDKCIVLRKQGRTLTEIVRITGKSKSSVYGYIRDIPLSPEKIVRIRKASGKRIRKFALARKGKSVRSFKKFKKWTGGIVSLTAHLLFDGGIYPRNGCAYSNRSTALLQQVEKYMLFIYEFKPVRYQDPVTGVRRISYYNVALAIYIEKKVRELLKNVHDLPINLKIEFVRAFFDDEGCIDYRPEENRRSVRGYQKDVKVLKTIKALLADFDIDARVVKPNEVVIVGKENLMKFEREINFSSGVYMNGNRSNSRWKKHVEKRKLLAQAIASFRN